MRTIGLISLLFLVACSQGESENAAQEAAAPTLDVASAPAAGREAVADTGTAVAVAAPRIAYTYRFAFRLAADSVTALQSRHLALCDGLGAARCQVVDMRASSGSGDFVQASLKLRVAAANARAFGDRIVATAGEQGGETVDRAIEAEDLAKQMVDTEARIRTKQALVDRLTALLATRSGNIQQAVEAERAVNAAQEELEQARAWLAEARGRVAMSTMELSYQSGSPLGGGFSEPIRDAFAEVATLTGKSIGMIVVLLAATLPWAALLLLGLWGVRRYRRWRGTRPGAEETPPTDPRVAAEA